MRRIGLSFVALLMVAGLGWSQEAEKKAEAKPIAGDLLPIFRAGVYMKIASRGVGKEKTWRRGSIAKWR